eukprot:gene9694-9853_t
MARSEQWLTAELTKTLGWDDFVVAGVVDVIVKAKSPAEVEDIVQAATQKAKEKAEATLSMFKRSFRAPASRALIKQQPASTFMTPSQHPPGKTGQSFMEDAALRSPHHYPAQPVCFSSAPLSFGQKLADINQTIMGDWAPFQSPPHCPALAVSSASPAEHDLTALP